MPFNDAIRGIKSQFTRFREVADGLVLLFQSQPGQSAIVIGLGQIRVELNGTRIIFDGMLELDATDIGVASVVVQVGIGRRQIDGLRQIFQQACRHQRYVGRILLSLDDGLQPKGYGRCRGAPEIRRRILDSALATDDVELLARRLHTVQRVNLTVVGDVLLDSTLLTLRRQHIHGLIVHTNLLVLYPTAIGTLILLL